MSSIEFGMILEFRIDSDELELQGCEIRWKPMRNSVKYEQVVIYCVDFGIGSVCAELSSKRCELGQSGQNKVWSVKLKL